MFFSNWEYDASTTSHSDSSDDNSSKYKCWFFNEELPAIVRAHITIPISRNVDFSISNMTQLLPATSRAQIAIIISKRNDSQLGIWPLL